MIKTCPKCGKEYECSKGDVALRRAIGVSSKYVAGLKETYETSKDYCNSCFKDAFKIVGQALIATLDQAQGSETPKKEPVFHLGADTGRKS